MDYVRVVGEGEQLQAKLPGGVIRPAQAIFPKAIHPGGEGGFVAVEVVDGLLGPLLVLSLEYLNGFL